MSTFDESLERVKFVNQGKVLDVLVSVCFDLRSDINDDQCSYFFRVAGSVGDRVNPSHRQTSEDERRKSQCRDERRHIFALGEAAVIAVRGPVRVAMSTLV